MMYVGWYIGSKYKWMCLYGKKDDDNRIWKCVMLCKIKEMKYIVNFFNWKFL